MGCSVMATEDFVLPLLVSPQLKERYVRLAFSEYVRSHPELRFCPGPNCSMIIRAKESKAKRIVCYSCKTTFWWVSSSSFGHTHTKWEKFIVFNYSLICSFRCGSDYHAPTDCDVIRQWLTKCADDSETANYISAHTKVLNTFQSI
jgi:ariadne-2